MKRSYLSQFLMVGVSAAALWAAPVALATAQEMPGEGATVKMGQATWDTGWFHAEIYKQLGLTSDALAARITARKRASLFGK